MHLTAKEDAILMGQEGGEAKQLAMQLLVDVGDFFNATRLIDVASTHISGVSYLTGGNGLIEQLKFFVEKGSKVCIPSTLNPCGMDRENWAKMHVTEDFANKQQEILDSYQKMGVTMTCSCTPYDFGHLPMKGQHIAWAESSAVTFANTFFGARTNKEDALSVFAAAVIGKTPYFGLHESQWRVPQLKVKVDTPIIENSDYGVLGHIVGKAFAGHKYLYGAIPLFKNLPNPRPHQIKALGAALASFGTSIFHIENVTPEQELFKENKFDESITIETHDVHEVYEEFSPPNSASDEPNITVIGCPNASLEEIEEVTKAVDGKKLKPGKDFWIFTNRAQKGMAQAAGYTYILEKAGVKIFSDTCPEVFPYQKDRYQAVLTDSAKAAHYIPAPNLNGLPTYILPIKKCVRRFFE